MTFYIQNILPFVITAVSFSVISYLCCIVIGRGIYSIICGKNSDVSLASGLSFGKSCLLILSACGVSSVLFMVLGSLFVLCRTLLEKLESEHSAFIPGINLNDLLFDSSFSEGAVYLLIGFFLLITLITFLSVYTTKRFLRFPVYSSRMMYTLTSGLVFLFFYLVFASESESGLFQLSVVAWGCIMVCMLLSLITIRFNYRMIMGYFNRQSFLQKHLFILMAGCVAVMLISIIPSTDWFVEAGDHYNKAVGLWEQKEDKKAFTEYCKAIDKDPELKDAYFNRGLIYFLNGQYSSALLGFLDYLEYQDEDPVAHYYAGRCYRKKGEMLSALKHFSKALTYKSDDHEIYQRRGYVYLRIGLYQSAIHDMNTSLRQSPEDLLSTYYRGYLYFLTGEYDKAIKDYNLILKDNPRDFEAAMIRYLCDKKLGRNRYSFPGEPDTSKSARSVQYITGMVQGTMAPEEALVLLKDKPGKDTYMNRLVYAFIGEYYLLNGEIQKAVSVFKNPTVFAYPNWVYYIAQKELKQIE